MKLFYECKFMKLVTEVELYRIKSLFLGKVH